MPRQKLYAGLTQRAQGTHPLHPVCVSGQAFVAFRSRSIPLSTSPGQVALQHAALATCVDVSAARFLALQLHVALQLVVPILLRRQQT